MQDPEERLKGIQTKYKYSLYIIYNTEYFDEKLFLKL